MLGSRITLSESEWMLPENWLRDGLVLFRGTMGWPGRLCLFRIHSWVLSELRETLLGWISWFRSKLGTSFPGLVYMYSLNTLSTKQLLIACSKSKIPNHSIKDPSCLSLIYLFSLLHLSNCLHSPHQITIFPLEEAIYIFTSTALLMLCSLLEIPGP